MLFVEITPGEFEKFTQKHFSHYTQTHINYEAQYNAHLLSVKNDDGGCVIAEVCLQRREHSNFPNIFIVNEVLY